MDRAESNSSWGKVPAIRLIVSKRVTLRLTGSFPWNYQDVRGPYWRIYWNDAPGAFVSCGGSEVELTPENLIVLSPDAVCSARATKQVRHFYVHCFVAAPFSEIKGQMFVLTNPELVRQAARLASTVNQGQEEWRTQMELLVYLNAVFLALPAARIPACLTYSAKVAKALAILGKIHKISNSELAKLVSMSRNGLLFLFKKETQTSPQAYARQLRLNEACVMLQHSNKSIDEIALETGFCDRYYFSRAFRQAIGCAPGHFRSRRYPAE